MKGPALSLMAIAALLAFSSCNKEKEVVSPKLTDNLSSGLLTANQWLMVAEIRRQKSSSEREYPNAGYDLFDNLPAYYKDNFWKFNSDNSLIKDEGSTKYDSTVPQTQSGTWAISDDSKTLTLTFYNTVTTYEILALDESTLKLRQTLELPEDVTNEETYTFKPL